MCVLVVSVLAVVEEEVVVVEVLVVLEEDGFELWVLVEDDMALRTEGSVRWKALEVRLVVMMGGVTTVAKVWGGKIWKEPSRSAHAHW